MTQKEAIRTGRANPEVKPATAFRRFSTREKLRILEEADACTELGEGHWCVEKGYTRHPAAEWSILKPNDARR